MTRSDPSLNRDESTGDDLLEMVRIAQEKGYAIDMEIFGGAHLDEFAGGCRLTGRDDAANGIRAGLAEMRRRDPNQQRFQELQAQAKRDGHA